jgi:NADH-quinone oxidoreductase subunit J
MPLDNVVFWVFAPISVASAIGMLLVRNAVHAALFRIVTFVCLAVFFLLLDAPFLFVIMLLGVDSGVPVRERLVVQRPLAFILGAAFVVELFVAIRAGVGFSTKAPDVFTANEGGNTQAVAKVLFTQYFFPFEVTSVLLLVAALAAMVLAHRKARTVTQAEIDAAAAAADAQEMPVYGAGATP